MRTLRNEAQEAAARLKQDATDLDAAARAEEAFNQGLQREKQAVSLRRTGKIDARLDLSWWPRIGSRRQPRSPVGLRPRSKHGSKRPGRAATAGAARSTQKTAEHRPRTEACDSDVTPV